MLRVNERLVLLETVKWVQPKKHDVIKGQILIDAIAIGKVSHCLPLK